MAYKHYSAALKQEAVALAAILGAEEAASQLGISDWRSVRRWCEKAGAGPELAAERGAWANLMNLSIARVTALVASGKLHPTTTATIAGIAARNLRQEPEREPETPRTDVERWADELEAAVIEVRPDLAERWDGGHRLASHVLQILIREDSYRERDDQPPLEPDEFAAFLLALDVDAWDAQHRERDAAHRARIDANREAAKARYSITTQPIDPDVAELLAEAEAYLVEHP